MFLNDCFVSFAAVTCVKLLFIPLYKSTDFEVHRNWMAITHEKPIKDWYFEDTSQWTLDYPPLFAWFEYLLSKVAQYFDAGMLQVQNLNYESPQTVFFMRLSVIVSDILYCYGVNRIFKLVKDVKRKNTSNDPWASAEVILAMLLLWNPGLLLVDHIHFQYNGFLNGILLISIADVFEKKFIRAAFWFSVLINLKHIYLYLAPAYFLFLLKGYCFKNQVLDAKSFLFSNFLKLGSVVVTCLLLSFGPFIYMGQLNQVFSRLFPVKRGLTHSYWAPNMWALYNLCDRLFNFLAHHSQLSNQTLRACSTGGLVQECEHTVLPTISTSFTLLLAILSILPIAWIIMKRPANPDVFLSSIILCSFGSFIFGYHVHEKAILLIILPLTIAAVINKKEASIYALLSIIGHFSLFPLMHQEGETPLKIMLLFLHALYMFSSLSKVHRLETSLINNFEKAFLFGLLALQVFYSFGSKALKIDEKLPFLPLMLISTYCAVGVIYCWIKYCFIMFEITTKVEKIKKKR